MSFINQSLLKQGRNFIWLNNFVKIFSDPNIIIGALRNTLIFVVGTTFLSFSLGFIWAIILNQGFRGSELLRGIPLVNWIIPGTAIGFLWVWMFNGQYGVINSLLKNIGIIQSNVTWMGRPVTAMIAIIIARAWQVMPWNMALLLTV